jgi:hypothetical protein
MSYHDEYNLLVMILLILNEDEFALLCLLKRRLFTPFEVILDNTNGNYEKAIGILNSLARRKMVELFEGRVIITVAGKRQLRKEQIDRGATTVMLLEKQ